MRYEKLKNDLPGEFAKITAHFGRDLDADKLIACAAAVTKGEVQDQSQEHNARVMTVGETYEQQRATFRQANATRISSIIAEVSARLYDDEQRLLALFE